MRGDDFVQSRPVERLAGHRNHEQASGRHFNADTLPLQRRDQARYIKPACFEGVAQRADTTLDAAFRQGAWGQFKDTKKKSSCGTRKHLFR